VLSFAVSQDKDTAALGSGTSTAMVIDRNGKVGIGTTSPTGILDVVGSSTSTVGNATQTLFKLQPGIYAGSGNRGVIDVTTASDNEPLFRLYNDGGGSAIHLTGDSPYHESTGGGDWGTISDERIKKDIQDYSGGLKVVNTLKPKQFKWNMDFEENRLVRQEGTEIGWTAQSMNEVYPKWVSNTGRSYKDDDGLVVDDVMVVATTSDFNAIVISAIQELSAEIDKLKQGDSNEQDESTGSGDTSGQDSGGTEGNSGDSSDSSEPSPDNGGESTGSSGSDSADDSSGGNSGSEPSGEWTKDQLKAYMDERGIEYNSGDTKDDLLMKIANA
jgi:hypothetical protein